MADISSSLMTEFITRAYNGYATNPEHKQQYLFRALDTENKLALSQPSRPPITGFQTPFEYPPKPNTPKDQCHIMWLLYRFEEFPHPNYVRNVHVQLDDQTIKDGNSCMVTGAWHLDRYSVRVAFDVALSAAVMIHAREDTRQAIQALRNEAVLDGGPLRAMPGSRSRSFQPLSEGLKNLQQRKTDALQSATWQPGGSALPIFLIADVSLEILYDIVESHKHCDFSEGEEIIFVDVPSVSKLLDRPNDRPFPSVPELPFRNASPEDVNKFVLDNFSGHAIHHQRFIILDQVTIEDKSSCILVNNKFDGPPPDLGFLRDRWPQVFLTVKNIDNGNMGFEDFASAAARHFGVVELD
ncbi:MAG: hypothetical protein M1822_007057 [Bathelium mastoideum]|nr:MAG: hypothetical protein M1822_007057 [Bathelium mastoideum]